MILITTYYTSRNINRQSEIDICLKKNFENKYIKKIYLLNDEIFDLNHININYKNDYLANFIYYKMRKLFKNKLLINNIK